MKPDESDWLEYYTSDVIYDIRSKTKPTVRVFPVRTSRTYMAAYFICKPIDRWRLEELLPLDFEAAVRHIQRSRPEYPPLEIISHHILSYHDGDDPRALVTFVTRLRDDRPWWWRLLGS